ncbi:ornithine cyclodeaminase [Paraoerskovia sediminicola]|uniref:Ornithine cyclodeaminase n=1 Tax=Paraoerskovia sediminicola TaxID=1138587 RepID=A0ABM8G1D8_9CELL|nr:ornithine cyclodeaminase [Paraoerskovia sediminicola]BDZ41898.1 ornithine cyclodeaminase [Paraoerskovia sediminicola]
MVAFLDVTGMTRWVSETGLEHVLADMVARVRADFRRWTEFERAPRVASHSSIGVIELMPTSDGQSYGFKYVNGHPANPNRGLQTVTAFGVLADVATGYPVFFSEMTLLTGLRTAATSAMAAKALARRDAKVMTMIGTGSQSEFQALAFRSTLGIETLRVWDTDPAAMDKLAANLRPLGFDVTVCASAAEATEGADVITTCTADKSNATVLADAMVRPGVHINAIGGDCPGKTELDGAILDRARVFVEHEPQTRIEGEIQQRPADFPVTELWTVLTGAAAGRTSAEEITVFDSVGFAIEDFSALSLAYAATRGTRYVQDLEIVAEPADPKNLFSLLSPARVMA